MKKILLVEDDRDLRELYAEVLRDEGFTVIEAADGQEGLALARGGDYALLLLDIMLPKVDGLQILKSLKSEASLAKIPMILLTNLDREAVIQEGFSLGADGYIIKSQSTPDQVVAEVKKLLTT
jgi:two-component system response regulator CpxR